MARPNQPALAQTAELSPQQMRQAVDRLQKRIEEVRGFNPDSIQEQFGNPEVARLQASVEDALVRTFGAHTFEYRRYSEAASFSAGPINLGRRTPIGEARHALAKSKERSIALLEQAVASLEERIAEAGESDTVVHQKERVLTRRVFVVHGHDEGARETVARFLEQIGFEAIILHEQANQGRTVIEKIEAHGEVDFAVVLLTPDDEGRRLGGGLEPRARQNVLLELGYFIGRLGRARVCALKRGRVEIPSDFVGVVWEPMDEGNGWKQALGRELQTAGHDVDWNRIMGR